MRFDDSLKTVLSGDASAGSGAQATWRQLVDLMGRGRAVVDEPAIARLRLLRQAVPTAVRAASGRALAFASPDARLVGFFAEDELAIAAPVLRTASLDAQDWIDLLPRLDPVGRSVLRHRRDLAPEVVRALAAFGATDFVLGHDAPEPEPQPAPVSPSVREPVAANDIGPVPAIAPLGETPFVALGDVARGLPLVAEALRHADAQPVAAPPQPGPTGFVISDLVARIDAFNKSRGETVATPPAPQREAGVFRYETDDKGVIRWIDGVARGALIGVSFGYAALQGQVEIDGIAPGALRRRSRFADARMQVGGSSDAAGAWRFSGVPVFDAATGRFTGFRGVGRRPRPDETTVPRTHDAAASESLRQLVHELRTPTNAIAGFAELIGTELLGPVPDPYRTQANAIRAQAAGLIAAIDDLDVAARIEGGALDLRSTRVAVAPLLARVADDLAPLAAMRRATVAIEAADVRDIAGDDRAIERLIGRLLAALVSAASAGETIRVRASDGDDRVAIRLDRPRALAFAAGDALLSLDGEGADEDGAPLLGTGFAIRLAQNLAVELGGALAIEADGLTLRLPAAVFADMGQASTN